MEQTLVLVPTRGELDYLQGAWGEDNSAVQFGLCGFGPVAAACRTMHLLCFASYRRVLLCGIAGTYTDRFPVGDVVTFHSVTIDGVGAAREGRIQSGYDLGFDTSVPNVIEGLVPHHQAACGGTLLTVCVCSDTLEQAADRVAAYPGVGAEDMEGYAVAMACSVRNVPLTILRGISNRAGDRDKRHWRIKDALESVAVALANTLRR